MWSPEGACLPQFYRPLNIRIVLVGVEVWNDIDKCSISQDPFTSLHEFLDWRKMKLLPRKSHDNAQLIRYGEGGRGRGGSLSLLCLKKQRPQQPPLLSASSGIPQSCTLTCTGVFPSPHQWDMRHPERIGSLLGKSPFEPLRKPIPLRDVLFSFSITWMFSSMQIFLIFVLI